MKTKQKIDYDFQTHPYGHWVKLLVWNCIPRPSDFKGLWSASLELLYRLSITVCCLLFRVFLICTFPVSIPLLAWALTSYDKKVVARNIKRRDEIEAHYFGRAKRKQE